MKYYIQPNQDKTYTILEVDGSEEAKCYVVDEVVANEMRTLAEQNQLQVVLYKNDGQIERAYLKLTKKLFKRNNSILIPFFCTMSILSSGLKGVSELVSSAILVVLLQVFQYRRMTKLKNEVNNQRYSFLVQPKIIKLRTTSQNLHQKYIRAMFAEAASLGVVFLVIAVLYLVNDGKQFLNTFFTGKERISYLDGPLYQMLGSNVSAIIYLVIFATLALYFASVYYLRCKDYVNSEIINNYRGLKAELSNGEFLGWEFSNRLPFLELPGYGFEIWNKEKVQSDEIVGKANLKIQELYQNRWQ